MLFLKPAIKNKFETKEDDGELMAVHIITTPSRKYVAGWWVQVLPNMFIRPCGTNDKLQLVYAYNIPVAPAKHYFKSINNTLRFTLFFPSIAKGITHIDIIEKESGSTQDWFNFYHVSMARINNGVLKH